MLTHDARVNARSGRDVRTLPKFQNLAKSIRGLGMPRVALGVTQKLSVPYLALLV